MPSTFLITTSDEFERNARAELKRIAPEFEEGEILAPGLFLVGSALDENDFAQAVAENHLIYVRHIFPVQAEIELANTPQDLEQMSDAAKAQVKKLALASGKSFSVQARILEDTSLSYNSLAIKEAIVKALTNRYKLKENIKAPEYIVSVVCSQQKAYLGISTPSQNLSDWAGGMRHYAKRPELISRAEFKLLEALEVFNLKLPPEGTALDLGAAPGGWTRILLEAGLRVTAVDPADLDARLEPFTTASIRGKGFKNETASLEQVRGYAADFLRQAAWKNRKFDLICNDIRMDALDAARLMAEFAVLLAPSGFALTTLKLPHETKKLKPAALVDRALEILQPTYPQVIARQLFHNRQEVTVLLRP